MLRFKGTGRQSVKALGPVECWRREWREMRGEVSEDFKGKRRGRWAEGELVGERGEARVGLAGSGSHAWDSDSVWRAGMGNFHLGHARDW